MKIRNQHIHHFERIARINENIGIALSRLKHTIFIGSRLNRPAACRSYADNPSTGLFCLVNFIFSNKGKTPLVIYDVKASCGCTVPTWPKAPIKPDGKSLIKVDFETKKQKGVFTKTIFVESNANEDVILLKLKGKVE